MKRTSILQSLDSVEPDQTIRLHFRGLEDPALRANSIVQTLMNLE